MVAISKVLNSGLLLAGQSVFQDVATPQQGSVQSYNILNFLGGSAPIFKDKVMVFQLTFPKVVKFNKFNCFQDMEKDIQVIQLVEI